MPPAGPCSCPAVRPARVVVLANSSRMFHRSTLFTASLLLLPAPLFSTAAAAAAAAAAIAIMATAAAGVRLNHIARESPDVKRLAAFYQEVLGFERTEAPNFGEFEVIWLRLSPDLALHLIERNPQSKLPEGPHGAKLVDAVADPRALPRGHHISFGVSNYDGFVQSLKERGIETFEKTQPDGKTRQVFFFDPDDKIVRERKHSRVTRGR